MTRLCQRAPFAVPEKDIQAIPLDGGFGLLSALLAREVSALSEVQHDKDVRNK